MRRAIKNIPKSAFHHKYPLSAILIISIVANLIMGGTLLNNKSSKYPFLSKRLFAQNQNDIIINFQGLRDQIKDYPTKNNVDMGIYFEYLPTGTSIGINEKNVFFGASLIKVPLVMRAYKMVENGELKKDQKVKIESDQIDKSFGTLWEKGAGAEVTVEDIIDHVLKESDNTAYNMLAKITRSNDETNGTRNLISDVYNYLDIPDDKAGGNYGITAKNYTSVLRSLYLSAYLNYQDSNELLMKMSESTFNKWLPQPIPKTIKVSHKFGVYDAEPKQYDVHADCGIVYIPKRPYALCMMIGTSDTGLAEKHMQTVSKTVFDFVSTVNKK